MSLTQSGVLRVIPIGHLRKSAELKKVYNFMGARPGIRNILLNIFSMMIELLLLLLWYKMRLTVTARLEGPVQRGT